MSDRKITGDIARWNTEKDAGSAFKQLSEYPDHVAAATAGKR